MAQMRKFIRVPKQHVIEQHFRQKVESGVRGRNSFNPGAMADELSHIRSLKAANPKITFGNVSGFYSSKGIDWRQVRKADLDKLRSVPDSRARLYTEDVKRRSKEYAQRKRQKQLYDVGVFKPRQFNLYSARLACEKKSSATSITPIHIERAKRILEELKVTEDKAMSLTELKQRLRFDKLFPNGKAFKRPLVHMRALGIIENTSWHIVVTEKYAPVIEELLKLKLDLLRADPEKRYMAGVIQRDHRGIIPPTINPDGIHMVTLERKVAELQKEIARGWKKFGMLVLENLDEFPKHLL